MDTCKRYRTHAEVWNISHLYVKINQAATHLQMVNNMMKPNSKEAVVGVDFAKNHKYIVQKEPQNVHYNFRLQFQFSARSHWATASDH